MSKTNQFLRLVGVQIYLHTSSKIWLLPLISYLILTFLNLDTIFATRRDSSLTANIWDPLFLTFSNPLLIFLVLNGLQLFLAGYLWMDTALEKLFLATINSRFVWLQSKFITSGLVATIHILLLAMANILAAVTVLPLEWHWSEIAQNEPTLLYLSAELVEKNSPVSAFLFTLFMLWMGWWFVAYFVFTVSLQTNQTKWGGISGIFLTMGNYLAYHWGFSRPVSSLFFSDYLLYAYSYQTGRVFVVTSAFIYWVILIFFLWLTSYLIVLKKDFLQS